MTFSDAEKEKKFLSLVIAGRDIFVFTFSRIGTRTFFVSGGRPKIRKQTAATTSTIQKMPQTAFCLLVRGCSRCRRKALSLRIGFLIFVAVVPAASISPPSSESSPRSVAGSACWLSVEERSTESRGCGYRAGAAEAEVEVEEAGGGFDDDEEVVASSGTTLLKEPPTRLSPSQLSWSSFFVSTISWRVKRRGYF